LASLDQLRRDLDASQTLESCDTFQQQAFDVLTSRKLSDALDIAKEDPCRVERYGGGPQDANAPYETNPTHLLVALRLVEAGARYVTLTFNEWDWHSNNFAQGRQKIPTLDLALSALIEDLHQRGLDKDVTVICWGEFGRSPRINKDAGRDHWPAVSFALLAGGGMHTGQVIGSTDRYGEDPKDRPVTFSEVFATLYHNLGIDVNTTTVTDLTGRPQYLVANNAQPIGELVY
jgi:uncharacterized protein (DUF1501 family)